MFTSFAAFQLAIAVKYNMNTVAIIAIISLLLLLVYLVADFAIFCT